MARLFNVWDEFLRYNKKETCHISLPLPDESKRKKYDRYRRFSFRHVESTQTIVTNLESSRPNSPGSWLWGSDPITGLRVVESSATIVTEVDIEASEEIIEVTQSEHLNGNDVQETGKFADRNSSDGSAKNKNVVCKLCLDDVLAADMLELETCKCVYCIENTSIAPPTPAEQSVACEDDLPETGGVKGCLPCQFQNLFKSLHVQLEDIAPLPKRKAANWKGGRKPVQSKILPSTVVKDAIHTAESERRQKKKGRITKVKKERCCCDDNLELFWIKRPKGCYGAKQANTIKPGDFVLVEYKGKKGSKFYTGEVL
ncbi:hypothetical protein QYM36_017158 [Artemia franciscana]|uniref:Uncharacterized protein n=1 Tax=Artemia franciscana TaxID=6661 RepID=A0AA88H520_ARTSF|nr:hypothetical protein QYM36_017158 [Artemia franciscana]